MGLDIEVVLDSISLDKLKEYANNRFGDMVKAVVDIEKKIMAVNAQLHSDEESLLLENGSKQSELWGINLYVDEYGDEDWIEFDSMINVRPSQNNRSRDVEDEQIRKKIVEIVDLLVKK